MLTEKERLFEEKKYDLKYYKDIYWLEDKESDPDHDLRFSFLSKKIGDFAVTSCLDVGCGTGILLRKLLSMGINAKGTEISQDAIGYFMQDILHHVTRSRAQSMPFLDNSFDMIFCSDVLEHVLEDDIPLIVKEFSRVSKELIVLTINLDHKYEYHPTILTRQEWNTYFLSDNRLRRDEKKENRLHNEATDFPEYDFFVFRK